MTDWQPLTTLPDLRRVGIIALDSETRDDRLRVDMGSGWPFRSGHLCGISVAYRAEGEVRGHYFSLRHPDTQNFPPEQVYQWVRDHIAAKVRFVTQNGLYDWGWLRAEAGIHIPPGERLEEISALATMVDENRFKYSLDALCAWHGLPGKDETLLRQGIAALGPATNKRKKVVPQNHLWQLPARYVGTYAETDAVNTLLLHESLDPILDREGTRAAYRLECDILPMVLEMRLRGIRIDLDAAERARDLLLHKRDAALTELSEKHGSEVGMHEIRSKKWLVGTFDHLGIEYPRTEKGNPSFTAGKTGWLARHTHWLPPLIATANKYDKAATGFLQKLIDHAVDGRIHAEINPHRSEDNGTKSFRFSYSDPPLQQMPSRDEEIAPLIRGVFLPEEGELWAKPDASQQEFRFVVHYATQHNLPKAAEAVARYLDDAGTDFHAIAAALTGLDRSAAKAVNFAKIYGAGVVKFATMIGKPLPEARRIFEQYDRELPFLHQLSKIYSGLAHRQGYITLYDRARRHFDQFAPDGEWTKNAAPCSLEEAQERTKNPAHPWYHKSLHRADTHTALNALIQGSAARHTKLWMRAVWREGIVPLLQMHDALDCSVNSREQAELVARLGAEAVQLAVPMRVDLKYGHNWGDAEHTWAELRPEPKKTTTPPPAPSVAVEKPAPKISSRDAIAGKTIAPSTGKNSRSSHSGGARHQAPLATNKNSAACRQSADDSTLALALRIWQTAKPIAGTPALRYLAEVRGIDADALPDTISTTLRFHPQCTFGSGIRLPCLIACYRDVATDEFAGIHRIALTPDVFAGGKVQRLTLGSWPTPRAFKLWPATDQLFLGEGIETVLAAATRLHYRGAPMRPAWAAGSSSNIGKFPVLHDVRQLTLLVDHDAAGEKCAASCRLRWREADRKVVRLQTDRPRTDFNDLVLERCAS